MLKLKLSIHSVDIVQVNIFLHLETAEAFLNLDKKVENLYRFGLCLPPEFFFGKSLIDLGSGTGEHTISLRDGVRVVH